MSENRAGEPLSWRHRVSRLPRDGVEEHREASEAERAALAADLEVPACTSLAVDYRIRPLGGGRYLLRGKLDARVTQTCSITLEPIDQQVEDTFVVELWPEDEIGAPSAAADHLDGSEPDEPEPIRDGVIDVGPIVREHLAMAIDPYPRKPGAELAWKGDAPEDEARPSPFAALARLKEPRQD